MELPDVSWDGKKPIGINGTVDVGNMLKGERNIYLGRNIPDYLAVK